MAKAKTISTIILFALAEIGLAQTLDDLDRLSPENHSHGAGHSYRSHINPRNEFTGAFSIAFLFYKEYFSSQDGMNCVFSPSCSVYAIQSVNKRGFLIGGLAAIDRLTRCNGLNQHQYPIDYKSRRFYDPVE